VYVFFDTYNFTIYTPEFGFTYNNGSPVNCSYISLWNDGFGMTSGMPALSNGKWFAIE
jgi:hypothetical protein